METKKCIVCGAVFEKKQNCSVKGWKKRKYCSNRCRVKTIPARFDYDISSQKFNRLTAIKRVANHGRAIAWLFKCDCGKTVEEIVCHVKRGDVKSCGCLQRDTVSKNRGKLSPSFKHGLTNTRFYRIWAGVRSRCLNKNRIKYAIYGGRGIKCLWGSFSEFKDDMYRSYLDHVKRFGEKQTQIDRIDNNGNYCKKNCRWVNLIEQANNKKNTIHAGKKTRQ